MNNKIPLFKIYWDKEDVKAVTNVIESGMNWAVGPNIEKFEKLVADHVGTKYALAFNSGTSALHSLMLSYDIKEGDEVIVPSFTFIATANAPLFVGAKPVFADIEKETFGLDPEDVEKRITKKTKAILPIHYGGCPCRIRELKKIAQKHNLILIEDAAEALGAEVKGKKVGTFGDAAMFSFCAPKVITIGEGAMITTSSKKIYEKLKLIRSHGRAETQNYFSSTEYMDYTTLGYNFRMSNIIAALGTTQMAKLKKVVRMRRKNADYLTEGLKDVKEIAVPSPPSDYFHLYQMYTIKVSKERDALQDHLNKKGISAKVYFYPVHQTYFYKNKLKYKTVLPMTKMLSDQALTLPMYPELSEKEMDLMIKEIKKFYTAN